MPIEFTVDEIGALVEAIDVQLDRALDVGTAEMLHLRECRRALLVELERYAQ